MLSRQTKRKKLMKVYLLRLLYHFLAKKRILKHQLDYLDLRQKMTRFLVTFFLISIHLVYSLVLVLIIHRFCSLVLLPIYFSLEFLLKMHKLCSLVLLLAVYLLFPILLLIIHQLCFLTKVTFHLINQFSLHQIVTISH